MLSTARAKLPAVADLPRLLAGLYVWNARQARYVLSGRRGPCPCQSRCDSGRDEAPGCEAVIGLRHPQTFRRICPALARNSEGEWRCSRPASEVRPHLGRFFGFHVVALVLALALFATAWQIVLRSAGYTIPWRDVTWPGNWSRVHEQQANQLVTRAKGDLQRGELSAAQLALATARRLDPAEHEASMLLAELQRLSAPAASDAIFREVIDAAPTIAPVAARRWCALLVARGDFVALRALAADRLRREPTRTAGFWVEALLFADRRAIPDQTLAALAADAGLNSTMRRALETVVDAPKLSLREQAARLESIAAQARLATGEVSALTLVTHHLGLRDLTMRILQSAPGELEPSQRIKLELDLMMDPAQRALALRALVRLSPDPGALLLAANELLRRPDAEMLSEFLAQVEAAAARPGAVDLPLRIAAFSATAAGGDHTQVARAVALVTSVTGGRFPAAEMLTFALSSPQPASTGSWAPLLDPAPLSTLYAVHERISPQAGFSLRTTSR